MCYHQKGEVVETLAQLKEQRKGEETLSHAKGIKKRIKKMKIKENKNKSTNKF